MINLIKRFKELHILGMNSRNIDYISKSNDRKLYPLVDDKLQTKKLMREQGLKTPELYGSIKYQGQVKSLFELLPKDTGFVIKPAQGSGGKGILVIVSQKDGYYIKANGEKLEKYELKGHCSNILAGLHSLGGKDDVVLIEKLIEFDDIFDGYSFEGVPDVRVIVYKGYPVMAMMRLSTSMSDAKANLHQGAVGVGINMADGSAISAVQNNRPISFHPDTNKDLLSLKIPHWDEILHLASRSFDMTNLGYLGADIVLDKKDGPMILELNARPGLGIQIANSCGLAQRLKQVDEVVGKHKNVKERILFSHEKFGKNYV